MRCGPIDRRTRPSGVAPAGRVRGRVLRCWFRTFSARSFRRPRRSHAGSLALDVGLLGLDRIDRGRLRDPQQVSQGPRRSWKRHGERPCQRPCGKQGDFIRRTAGRAELLNAEVGHRDDDESEYRWIDPLETEERLRSGGDHCLPCRRTARLADSDGEGKSVTRIRNQRPRRRAAIAAAIAWAARAFGCRSHGKRHAASISGLM